MCTILLCGAARAGRVHGEYIATDKRKCDLFTYCSESSIVALHIYHTAILYTRSKYYYILYTLTYLVVGNGTVLVCSVERLKYIERIFPKTRQTKFILLSAETTHATGDGRGRLLSSSL
jgi:hypothetical protein